MGFEGRPRRVALRGSVHLSKLQNSGREFIQGSAVRTDMLAIDIFEDRQRSNGAYLVGTGIVASSSGVRLDL